MVPLQALVDAIRSDVLSFHGNPQWLVSGPAPLVTAQRDQVAFCNKSPDEATALIEKSACSTFVVRDDFEPNGLSRGGVNLIGVRNPRLSFMRMIGRSFAAVPPRGIDPSAQIDPSADVHPDAYVGPLSFVGKSSIGAGSVLWGNVFVYDGVRIGRNVTIHAGTVLGADGFGYERNEAGEMEKFPHFGGILIEDNVEIGANTCVDRGTLSDTIIRRGAKIDNLVHVAHNVEVGPNAVVIAHAMIGGSTKIGARAWIAPSACLRDQLKIGDDATVGLGSVVTKSVEGGETVLGSPARPIGEQLRINTALKKMAQDA